MNKQIVIRGFVTIKQGDKVLARAVINHFVDAGLKGIISTLIHKHLYSSGTGYCEWELWYSSWSMYLGSDIATVTTTGMTALQSPIGAAPGTPPNSKSASTKDGGVGGDNDGIWNVVFMATWDAGTVSGTLGELALYMRAPDKITFGWTETNETYTPSVVMISRLSSADTDFSSFVIDEEKPLTVEWKVQLAFA